MSSANQAADFKLSFTTDLTSITFWSLEASTADYAGSIFYRIVGNTGGSPDDTTVYASGSATPTRSGAGTASGLSVMKNDFALSVAGLLAGTYWLELHNGGLAASADTDFYWSFADADAINGTTSLDQEFALPGGVAWTTNDAEHAFLVNGDRVVTPPPGVPEPGTMVLAALAGIALLATRRRRA
ncbi:MAG: PEP-CTERM sorting domain-containing protein [Burkholderiales bacterium]|nr:PEP-CTERM sorting domain-containing protein [Burkholderiales bacterium]